MSFQYSYYFLLLIAIVPLAVLLYVVIQQKKTVIKKLGDQQLIHNLIQNYSSFKFRLKYLLLLFAFAFLCLTVANLHKLNPSTESDRAGIDVMVALDVSKSMYAEDAKPSRLQIAKQFVNHLIAGASDNRIGLVVFAGRAYLQMPLTSDVSIAGLYIANASPDDVPVQGTVVADALRLCNNSLDTKEDKFKAVVLISDGEDHDPNVDKAIQQLFDNGVVVYTVGVGSADGSPIKEPGAADYKTDATGKTVISRLNEKELVDIAAKTNGSYLHLTDAVSDAGKVAGELNAMQKKLITQQGAEHQYISYFPVFLLPALIILLVETYISEVKRRRTK